jgi:chemotaxis protein MotB
MTRTFRYAALAALGVALTGCVSNEKYQAQKLAHDALVEQLADAQRDASTARAEADAYKNQLTMLGSNGNSKDAMLVNLQQQNSDLQRQLEEMNRQYESAVNKVGTGQVLPPALTNVLEQFAQQYPDLVDFDATKGIVKFKSDVTFDPGSAQVTPNAKTAVGRFAQILNSPEARGYELMVVGHTDNTKVVNPATVKAGHLDNWYLSAHRAIAVGNELQRSNVSSERMQVAGCADQRPVASNATTDGKRQNRRVEVLILPNTIRGGVARASAPTPPSRPTRAAGAARRVDLNKDTANTDQRPTFNK